MVTVKAGKILATLGVAAGLVLSGGPAFATPHHGPRALTCTGGEIQSGTYLRITVASGMCTVAADATVHVIKSIHVLPGAMFDAQSAPATITVGHNVTAGAGSMLGLGCQPDYPSNTGHPCLAPYETGSSTIKVHGNVRTEGAAVVLLNGIEIKGNVNLQGGGHPDIPWSIKNNMIGGNVTVTHVTTNWFGVLFNTIGKNVRLFHITVVDYEPGATHLMYVVRNVIGRDVTCYKIADGVSAGFVPGLTNTIGGQAKGQCKILAS